MHFQKRHQNGNEIILTRGKCFEWMKMLRKIVVGSRATSSPNGNINFICSEATTSQMTSFSKLENYYRESRETKNLKSKNKNETFQIWTAAKTSTKHILYKYNVYMQIKYDSNSKSSMHFCGLWLCVRMRQTDTQRERERVGEMHTQRVYIFVEEWRLHLFPFGSIDASAKFISFTIDFTETRRVFWQCWWWYWSCGNCRFFMRFIHTVNTGRGCRCAGATTKTANVCARRR